MIGHTGGMSQDPTAQLETVPPAVVDPAPPGAAFAVVLTGTAEVVPGPAPTEETTP